MTPEYASNSHKSKEQTKEHETCQLPEKRVEKAIVSSARTRKKSEARKIADIFMPEDVESVKSHILYDIIIPAAKDTISKIVTNGIDMILYGEAGSDRKKSTASKISYQKYYNDRDHSPERYSNIHRTRTGYEYEDIILDSRGEAESVLERLDEIVSMYGMASVADMYDLCGVSGQYTDTKYGWTNIRSAQVVRIRDGYVIKMPRIIPLDN